MRRIALSVAAAIMAILGCSDGDGSVQRPRSGQAVFDLPQHAAFNSESPLENDQEPPESYQPPLNNPYAPPVNSQQPTAQCASFCQAFSDCIEIDCADFCIAYSQAVSFCPPLLQAVQCVVQSGARCGEGELIGANQCRNELEELDECFDELDDPDDDGPPFDPRPGEQDS